MKTIILFLSLVLSASAATLYPVLTDNSGRTFTGGATNLALLSGTNVFSGTNTFNTNTILGTAKLQDTLDGKPTVALTNVAQLNQSQTFTGPSTFHRLTYSPALLGYETGTNVVVDAQRPVSYVTLTNTTYFAAASNFTSGASVIIVLKQDATGGRAVTFDTNFWKFPGGFTPSITTNANAIDVLSAVASPFSTNFLSVQTPNLQ